RPGQPVEHPVARLVAGTIRGRLLVVLSHPEHMVVGSGDERVDHLRHVGGFVGVVAVDHHVDVRVDIGEGPPDDVALARDILLAHDGSGLGGALRRAIARAVVIDVDRDAGNGGPEVADALRDGDLLVVAGNDRRDSDRFRIHTLSHRRAPVGPGAQICRCHWSTPRIWTAGYGTGNSNAPSPEHAPTTRTRAPTAVAADRTQWPRADRSGRAAAAESMRCVTNALLCVHL